MAEGTSASADRPSSGRAGAAIFGGAVHRERHQAPSTYRTASAPASAQRGRNVVASAASPQLAAPRVLRELGGPDPGRSAAAPEITPRPRADADCAGYMVAEAGSGRRPSTTQLAAGGFGYLPGERGALSPAVARARPAGTRMAPTTPQRSGPVGHVPLQQAGRGEDLLTKMSLPAPLERPGPGRGCTSWEVPGSPSAAGDDGTSGVTVDHQLRQDRPPGPGSSTRPLVPRRPGRPASGHRPTRTKVDPGPARPMAQTRSRPRRRAARRTNADAPRQSWHRARQRSAAFLPWHRADGCWTT